MKFMSLLSRRERNRGSVKRCAFTGYRPQKLPFGFNEEDARCYSFKFMLRENIEELIGKGFSHFISGGAMGMDMFAAEIVLDLREKYPWITLEMVSPFDGQAERWSDEYRARHDRLFADADKVTRTGHAYTTEVIRRRNCYLVDNADLLLAAYDGVEGGTAMTVRYARKHGVPVRRVMPAA